MPKRYIVAACLLCLGAVACGADDTITPVREDGGSPDGATDAATDATVGIPTPTLALANPGGGAAGLGAWTLFSEDGTSTLEALTEAKGKEWSRGVGPEESGFAYNKVDDRFYGIITGAGVERHGVLISVNAPEGTVEKVMDLPRLQVDDNFPLGSYVQRPVISPDGKSLLAVASSGGLGPICGSCGTHMDGSAYRLPSSGGLVHVNLDPDSADHLKATAVFSFSGVGASDSERLHNVLPHAVLGRDAANTKDVLFVVAEGATYGPQGGPLTKVAGKAFFVTPTDPSDWSAAWEVTGHVEALGDEGPGRITRNLGYDKINHEFALAEQDVYCSDVNSCAGSEIFALRTTTVSAELPKIMSIPNYNCHDPAASFYKAASAQLICRGLTSPTDFPDAPAKWFDVSGSQLVDPTLRRDFSLWYTESPSKGLRQPFGISLDGAGNVLINASTDWVAVNEDVGFLASQIVLLNTGDTSVSTLVEGNAELGWLFTGPPAVGGKVTEPIENRYVVQFALGGGTLGYGTVLIHDRFMSTNRAVSLGLESVAYPSGRLHVLGNGHVLGNARFMNDGSALTTRERALQLGVYVLDPNSSEPTPRIVSLPTFSSADFNGTVEQDTSNVSVAEVDGTLWALTHGGVPLKAGDAALLAALDPDTAAPSGEVHAFGTESEAIFDASEWVSSLTAKANTLFFFGPRQNSDVNAANQRGHRAWCVDLSQRDGNTPKSGFALLNEPMNGPSAGHWDPVEGATLSSADSELYVLTRKLGATDQGAILRVKVSDCVATGPSFIVEVADLGAIPSTGLLDASDGHLYFGTEGGKLMRYDTTTKMVSEVADFAAATGKSRVSGFLTEDSNGRIFGVVADKDDSGAAVARRLFTLTVADQNHATRDISGAVHPSAEMPGVTPLTVLR